MRKHTALLTRTWTAAAALATFVAPKLPALTMAADVTAQLTAAYQRERAGREAMAREAALQQRQRRIQTACVRGFAPGEVAVTIPVAGACAGIPACCSGMLADRGSPLAAIVCHPWGPMGGSMHDPNVLALADTLGESGGVTTLRFNFRCGIGRGHSSADDIRAAWAFLRSCCDPPPSRLILAGYSYGSLCVADAAPSLREHLSALILLAPPLSFAAPLFFCRDVTSPLQRGEARAPALLISGTADQFCSARRYERFSRGFSGGARATMLSVRGADHFSLWMMAAPAAQLASWLQATFGCPLAELRQSAGEPVAAPGMAPAEEGVRQV